MCSSDPKSLRLKIGNLASDMAHFLEENAEPLFANSQDTAYFRELWKKRPPKIVQKSNETKIDSIIFQSPPQEVVEKVAPMVCTENENKPLVAEVAQPQTNISDHLSPTVIPNKPSADLKITTKKEIRDASERETKPKISFSKWKSLCQQLFPKLTILQDIPSDIIAKRIASRWQTKNSVEKITVLFIQEIPEHKLLLDQITLALDVYFGPAKMIAAEPIEKEKQWEAFLSVTALEHVICCDHTLWQLPGLMQFYKESSALKKRKLGEKSLFLLPDLSLYIKDPLLKRSLWKALCQTLSPSFSTKI